ncbi:MAG: outer membrane protein assembly factor BamA [Syntrophobacteraceae bacterium]|nr:outer membrane protein assembly factor BamA [Syntrophobacteraceae bacterium]
MDELFARLGARVGLALIEPARVERAAGGPVRSEAQAKSIGNKLGASYVMFGNYKQTGESISIQATLVDMSGEKKPVVLLAEQQGTENLASAVEKIVGQTTVDVVGKSVIAEVRVAGNTRIESAAIEEAVKSKKGQLYNPVQVSDDIRAIFKMGYFEKVDAEVKNTSAGKILTFVVKENPIISKLVIKGNKKEKKKDILAAVTTKQYAVLKRSDIAGDVQKIRKLYQEKGYYNVDVSSDITFPNNLHEAVVTYDINENGKVYVKSIKFTGNKHIKSSKLIGEMQTRPWSLLSYVTDRGILQRDILETDIERLNAYYHDIGYMDAVVGSPDIKLEKDGFHITIPVDEGYRYKIESATLSGDLIDDYKDKIEKKLETKANEFFNGGKIRHDLDLIKSIYMNEGYAKVEVDPRVKRDPATHTVAVDLLVKKYGIIRIGRITITGNTRTRDYVIRRAMKIAEGDIFSAKAIQDSQYALRRLDFFKDVEIVPVATPQSNIMDLNVKITEKQTGTISVGGGYSTQDGLFATGQIQQKNLNGTGQYLGLQAMVAQSAQYYMLSYTKPWIFDTRFSGGFDIYDWVRGYQDFMVNTYGVKLRTGYPLGNYSNVTAYYVVENSEINSLDALASNDPVFLNAEANGWQLKSGVGVGFERNTTDQPFLPTIGSYMGVTVEYDSKNLGGSYNLLKQDYHVGYYHPLFWKFIGHVRAEAGFENGTADIPIFERYFLGGIDSMRGWKFGYLGPKDANGLVVGGNKYAVINTEVLFPILEHYGVRGLVFFDYGNAFPAGQQIDFSNFKEDIGPGIRWNSPFGPLRIEMGYVLNKKTGDPTYEWQFSAGAFF